MRRSDLDDLVGPGGQQLPRGGLVVHVHDAVLAVVEGDGGRSAAGHRERVREVLRDGTVVVSWGQVGTHSSSLMDSWQPSQTRTSNSKPMSGMAERRDEHLAHTARPHFLQ